MSTSTSPELLTPTTLKAVIFTSVLGGLAHKLAVLTLLGEHSVYASRLFEDSSKAAWLLWNHAAVLELWGSPLDKGDLTEANLFDYLFKVDARFSSLYLQAVAARSVR